MKKGVKNVAKLVKDVFFNCVSNVDRFKDANVDEIKFSKKLLLN